MKINELLYAKVLLHAKEHYEGDFTLIKKTNGYYFCFEQCWEIDSDVLDEMAHGETAEEAMAVGYANDTYYRECDICFNHELYKNDFKEKIREKGYFKYMTISQAERKWRKEAGTVQLDCNQGVFDNLVQAGVLAQRIADTWLVSEEAMKQVYGDRDTSFDNSFRIHLVHQSLDGN